jgi:hypothetical protein
MKAVYYQEMFFLDILTLKMGLISYPRFQNGITTLGHVKCNKRAGPKTCSISVSFCQENAKCSNVHVLCDTTSENIK